MSSTPLLSIIKGNSQSIPGYQAFASPLQVLVVNNMGQPVSESVVEFLIQSTQQGTTLATFAGGQPIALATTDATGLASSSIITAGATPGEVVVTASCGAATPVSFKLTITYPVVAEVTIQSGDWQFMTINQAFNPLSVFVGDVMGNPVHDDANSDITFQINGNAAFATGSKTAKVSTVQAVATSPIITGVPQPCTFTVVASALNAPATPFTTFNQTVQF